MKWNKCAPPAVGWWPASHSRNLDVWRWWDGYDWSLPAGDSQDAKRAAEYAACPSRSTDIEWRNWPKALRHLPGYPLNPSPAGRT